MNNQDNSNQLSAELATSSDEARQPSDPSASGSLEKVREILFGPQARDYERRLARLEDRVMKETTDLRDEMKKRFDSLESYIKKEVALIDERLRAERDERDKSNQEISQVITVLARSFEKRAADIDERISKESKEVRDQMLAQYNTLMDEILRKHKELGALLDREARELRVDKVDRFALAMMFNEVALRLNNDLVIPVPEDPGND
jgi:hypothetical protein